MKTNFKKLACITLLLAALPLVGFSQIINKKVSFAPGKSSTVIKGLLVGDQTIDYAFVAKKGQKLKLTMKADINAASFNVLPPGSDNVAIFIGENEGDTCELTLPNDGKYKIRVFQMRSTARKGTKVNYSIDMSITSSSSSSGDAKVSGTNFNATGELRSAKGSTPSTAKYGVIRQGNGRAEVHIKRKSAADRVFVFANGEWSCKSGGCDITFAKISFDEWEVICNGNEKYYINDAIIYGG